MNDTGRYLLNQDVGEADQCAWSEAFHPRAFTRVRFAPTSAVVGRATLGEGHLVIRVISFHY